jgi:membrane protease YdiL (CAAX protease family)
MRAGRLSSEQWRWSLAYCFFSLIFMASIINVVYRFLPVPETGQMDLSMFPWWTLYPSLVMLSINAGVSEEAGFRGFMQGGLERRYGPATAIITTSVLFWLAHFNHPTGPARWVLLIGYRAALGALTWAVQSIWPAIVVHSLTDAVSFTTLASDAGPDWFMRKPAPFAETGVDVPFVVFSILLAASIVSGIAILRRLKALA